MNRRSLVPLAASAVLLLSTGRLYAEGPAGEGPHPRAVVAFGPSLLIVPGAGTLLLIDAAPQFGVQLTRYLGLVLAINLDFRPTSPSRLQAGGAILVEFTFDDRFSVGAGPEADYYGTGSQADANRDPEDVSGRLYGGKLHFGWHALTLPKEPPAPGWGTALTIGADVRLLGGRTTGLPMPNTSGTVARNGFAVMPELTLGFELR